MMKHLQAKSVLEGSAGKRAGPALKGSEEKEGKRREGCKKKKKETHLKKRGGGREIL